MSGLGGAVDLTYHVRTDPFDAGPYTRLQEALGRRRPLIIQPGPRALALAGLAWLPLVVLVLVLLLFVSPLLVFTSPLMRLRVRGIYGYGQLADALGRRFEGR